MLQRRLPFSVVLTKADRLSSAHKATAPTAALAAIHSMLSPTSAAVWGDGPRCFTISSKSGRFLSISALVSNHVYSRRRHQQSPRCSASARTSIRWLFLTKFVEFARFIQTFCMVAAATSATHAGADLYPLRGGHHQERDSSSHKIVSDGRGRHTAHFISSPWVLNDDITLKNGRKPPKLV
jgi:hypothetical protein